MAVARQVCAANVYFSKLMPTYDYVCESCGHQFEAFQSMSALRLTDCPLDECAGPVKRKIGTGAGIVFKGSGFYQTDYRSESYKQGASKAEADSKPAPKESSKASPKPSPAKGE